MVYDVPLNDGRLQQKTVPFLSYFVKVICITLLTIEYQETVVEISDVYFFISLIVMNRFSSCLC